MTTSGSIVRRDRRRMQMPAAARLKLMVAGEEAAKAGDSHLQVVFARQGHDAYVIRPRPVKGGALHQQDFLLQQEVEHHFWSS